MSEQNDMTEILTNYNDKMRENLKTSPSYYYDLILAWGCTYKFWPVQLPAQAEWNAAIAYAGDDEVKLRNIWQLLDLMSDDITNIYEIVDNKLNSILEKKKIKPSVHILISFPSSVTALFNVGDKYKITLSENSPPLTEKQIELAQAAIIDTLNQGTLV